jgi:hypothetical protein
MGPVSQVRLVCLGLVLNALPQLAYALEIAIKRAITTMPTGALSASNSSQKIKWFEQSQNVNSPTEFSVKKTLRNKDLLEYEYQSLNIAHRGQFARESCSFFGCAYVGTGLLTGYQTADTVKIRLNQHRFTYHLSNDNLLKNLALLLGIDILDVEASAAGFNFYEKKAFLVPVPNVGAKVQLKLNQDISLITKISQSKLSKRDNSLQLISSEISVLYRQSEKYFLEFGYQNESFHFEYTNRTRVFGVNDELQGPFLRFGVKFK